MTDDLSVNFKPLAQTDFPIDVETAFTPPDESKDSKCCRAVRRTFEGLLTGGVTGGGTLGLGTICKTITFMWPIATTVGGVTCVATTFRNYLKKWLCSSRCCKKENEKPSSSRS